MVEIREDAVRLQTIGGRTIRVEKGRLSGLDRAYVADCRRLADRISSPGLGALSLSDR